ncbi:hypothetical protein COO60DRAFT_1513758 [Scenedesmus sp. NREL 46B-D3]|nr:hypothetical protein COO60DRAFT_1513758 [Scenedesmus sp. NREL 46B-D3]
MGSCFVSAAYMGLQLLSRSDGRPLHSGVIHLAGSVRPHLYVCGRLCCFATPLAPLQCAAGCARASALQALQGRHGAAEHGLECVCVCTLCGMPQRRSHPCLHVCNVSTRA